ncbi:hypothetical protein [Williamsia soli]|uniref:hypothetical protein n=1 Tax=Williamsia soli TaxID=364929 RepID=UPI001A9FB5BB|nr:hypothetical protein [Williamsia soli]
MTTTSREAPRDITAILGMHTPAAKGVVAVYIVAITIVAFETRQGITTFWPIALGLVVLAAGTIGLITVPGDPLPVPATICMASAGAIASALMLWVMPVPLEVPLQAWTHGAGTTILCFMSVRGRWISAWWGLFAMAVVYGLWGALTDQGFVFGAVMVAIDGGPLAMATLLSFTLRPSGKAVFALRDAATARISALSAAQAAAEERDARLRQLDEVARPLLERIATAEQFTAEESETFELVEANLRDRLRAPALTTPDIDVAARVARTRGVEVVLIDDRGMDATPEDVKGAVRARIAETLSAAENGDVCVRVLPPGRAALASIYIHDSIGTRRITFDHEGAEVQN